MPTRFGLLVPHFGAEAGQDLLIEGARLAERVGFDSLWVRDHLVFHPHGMEGTDRTFVEPLITLTYLAGVTQRIGLGTATIIPFRHPINMAYSVASMSWITRRPFDLGIGAGNFQHEFDVIGQGSVERPAMMREQIHIARRFWAGETVDWKSELYSFSDVDLKPQPVHPIPVWWGGGTPASGRLAVEFCDGWLPGRITFPTYETRVAKIRELEAEAGRTPVLVGAIPITSIGATREEAVAPLNLDALLENANEMKFWTKPESGRFSRLEDLDGSLLAGSPDDIVRGIQRYQQIGCDLLIIDFRLRFRDWLSQIDLFAREVLPRVS
jgi:alkanesulfonate monooxygenase SsuD/methylene tetrahydromethanopterin reductase-like flavin-dependent oxidoreductase (luciferase family)